ncbi:MAG TPA: 2OG-Fe(II) oxygenase, partial [Caulobacteraceae bacterium]
PDVPAGLTLIRRAAELGGAYAWAVLAVVSAFGLGRPPDWPSALDQLQRSAELGYDSARNQLRLLAGAFGGAAPAAEDWAGSRRGVDLQAWRSPPPGEIVSSDPLIRIVRGFAPPEACGWLISRVRDRLQPAPVFDTAALRPAHSQDRTNSAAGFTLIDADLVVMLLRERLAAAAGLQVGAMEAPQVFHYAVGQTFAPHFDFLDPDYPGHARSLAEGGQRVATLLVYLNDAYEGGETDFLELGLKHRGGPGDALMFWNVDAAGAPDRRMFHAGAPPTKGEKWLLSQWVRERAR